jgi:hypothetical protein
MSNNFNYFALRKKMKKGYIENKRRGGRVVEGARLESVYTSQGYRGFESRSLRTTSFESLILNCK